MKRNILYTLILAVGFFTVYALSQEVKPDDLKGTFINKEETGHIRFFKGTDGKYYGKTEWLKEPNDENGNPKTDIKNPDPKKRDRPRLGMIIARGFTWDAKTKRWSGGTIYDPNNGKTYSGYMYFDENDKNTLNLRGYVAGMTWLGRTSQWKRVK